jgi:hypothetical protein
MKTCDAIFVFGSVRALAEALGITVQAVYLWGEEVPALRRYQVRELRPGRFNPDGSLMSKPSGEAAA